MTQDELDRAFDELKGRIAGLTAQLGKKANAGNCTKSLRQAYADLRTSSENLSAKVRGYVDKGTSTYETFFALFCDYEGIINKRQSHTEIKPKTEQKGLGAIEGDGEWSGKYFDPSLNVIGVSGTGVKLDMSAVSGVFTVWAAKFIGLSIDFTVVNGNAILLDNSKMVALKNAVCAASNLATAIAIRLDATDTKSNMSAGHTEALANKANGLSTYFM